VSTQHRNKLYFHRLKVPLSFNVCICDVKRVGQISDCGVQAKDSSVARQHFTQIYYKIFTLSRGNVLFFVGVSFKDLLTCCEVGCNEDNHSKCENHGFTCAPHTVVTLPALNTLAD
jgi:hypothetical protein